MADKKVKAQEQKEEGTGQMVRVERSLGINRTVDKLRDGFSRAIKWITGEEIRKVEEESEQELEAQKLLIEASDELRVAYEDAVSRTYGDSPFNRLYNANTIELQHEVYQSLDRLVRSVFIKDLEFCQMYRSYVDSLNLEKGATKMFRDKVEIEAILDNFGGDLKSARALLIGLFEGKKEIIALIFGSGKLLKIPRDLRGEIIKDLMNKSEETVYLFLKCLDDLQRYFIVSEERAKLLMEYAVLNTGRKGANYKRAEEFILGEENKENIYR